MARKYPTQAKAKKILSEGVAQGHELTKRQRGFFGMLAGGKIPRRARRSR